MGISVTAIVILLMYSIGINVILLELAKVGVGVNCPNLSTSYNTTNQSWGWGDITDLALGRCEGLPFVLVALLELPVIAGLFYVIRAFAGAT